MKQLKEYIVERGLFTKSNYKSVSMPSEKEMLSWVYANFKNFHEAWIEDGEICIRGDLVRKPDVRDSLTCLKYPFKEVSGNLDLRNCPNLESLKNSPRYVGWDVYCNLCSSLESLEGGPERVGHSFYCNTCSNLKNLKGAPKSVKQDFFCFDCKKLESLEGAPKQISGTFRCEECPSLHSLEGCPDAHELYCSGSTIKTLKGMPHITNLVELRGSRFSKEEIESASGARVVCWA